MLTDCWEQVDFPSGDVTTICIKGKWGKLTIFNIYNDCKHNDTLSLLIDYHRAHINELLGTTETQVENHLMWTSNFNRHHPLWDAPENNSLFTHEATEHAEILIQILAEVGLESTLPAGIPIHKHNVTKRWSQLDQVFVSELAIDTIDQCEALPNEQGLNMDHFPIMTKLKLAVALAPVVEVRNYRDVNWKEFHNELKKKIGQWGIPTFIKMQGMLDQECKRLTDIIQEVKVPKARIGPHADTPYTWLTLEL